MKPLRVPAIAALAGALLLVFLFPRIDPSAIFGAALDRAEAIQRARQLTSRYGVSTAGWKVAATQVTDEKLRAYLSAFPDDPAARLFAPVAWGVVFIEPTGKQTVRVKLFADGRPAEWELKPASEAPAPPVSPETVLQDFAGSSSSAFKPVDQSSWNFPMVATLTLSRHNGRLLSAVLSPAYARGFSYDPRTGNRVGTGVAGFLSFAGFCVAFALAMRACSRGWLSWRVPAGSAAALVVWGALMMWAGPDYQAMLYGKSGGLQIQLDEVARQNVVDSTGASGASLKIAALALFVGPVCLPFLTGFAFAAAGFAAARGRLRRKWYSLELLFRGKIVARQVSLSIAAGALCGLAAAAAPYATAILFRAARLLFHNMGVLSAPVPLTALVLPAAAVPAFGFLGFAYPAAYRLRKRFLRIGALAVLAAVFLFVSAYAFDRLLPSLIATAIAAAIYFRLYQKFDLLAVAAAMMTARAAAAPLILLAQPAGGLRDSGVRLLAFLAAAIAAFVNFGVRGRDAESGDAEDLPEPEIASTQAPSVSNLKRLEAEFQVARKAQQDALPAAPPVIQGYSLSGSCDPALQVGGDLYDLFPLPDGRLAIAVADVSGKGVPAALYMMVTKGLLSAIVQDSSDLAHILQQINLHLYRACKRKVFVTMAAVAIHPASRRLEYARAGHNPIVWRRALRGETMLRKPPGLGMGMCPNERFSRTLRLEEIDLEPGDAVVLYSDGITEAVNASMEQFGEERLMHSVESTDGQSAAETRTAILRDLADFTAGAPARDDVTVVVLRVSSTAIPGCVT
ncbi:membrane hypothetical protein [Candidatus Sulfopaludibacter sp. SbA6]|nr:membrane hypothetical protein [Candidatus Sulfopaludibacter sp. SbA6]